MRLIFFSSTLHPIVVGIFMLVPLTSFALNVRLRSSFSNLRSVRKYKGTNTLSKRQVIQDRSRASGESSIATTSIEPGFSSWINTKKNIFNDRNINNNKEENSLSFLQQKRKIKSRESKVITLPQRLGIEENESLILAVVSLLAVGTFSYFQNYPLSVQLPSGSNLIGLAREVLQDPAAALNRLVELTDSMGPSGILYFGVAYCIAEIVAIPATPLTASAGYLFGPIKGTSIVLLSASIAAGISFAIGRTLLRDYVEGVLQNYPKFAKLDRAIGREGFKLMLLLRLSPIFPFSLSNYFYGASSISFPAFFSGTLLGFAPGTFAYVYTGYAGKALTMSASEAGSDVYPWFVYAGGLTLFAGLLKLVADTATEAIEEIEAEEKNEKMENVNKQMSRNGSWFL